MKKQMELQIMPKGQPPHKTAIKMTGLRVFRIADIVHRVGDVHGEIWVTESFLREHGLAKSITIEFDEEDKKGL